MCENCLIENFSLQKNVTEEHDFTRDHDQHDPKIEQEPTLGCDQDKKPGTSGGRKNPGNEHQGPTIQKIAMDFQPPGFFKRLTVVNVCNRESADNIVSCFDPC